MLQKAPESVADVLKAEDRGAARRRVWRWAIGAGAVAVVAAGAWFWLAGSAGRQASRYTTEAVTRGDIDVTVVATGTIEPIREADVTSTVAGTITSVEVDYNDRVAAGQPLARLDTRDLEARLARAQAVVEAREAGLLTAQTNLTDARAALSRANELAASQTVSIRDIELANSSAKRAQAALAIAEADLSAARADFQSAQNELFKACICAPIDGVVLSVNATQGQSIVASALGQPLFTIASDLSQVELHADIDEADIGAVSEGDTASFVVEAWPERTFAGTIRQLRFAPAVVDGVVSYRAVLSVDNADLLLRPGMTATADIGVDAVSGVLSVPNSAFRFSPDEADGGLGGLLGRSSIEIGTGSSERTLWVLRNDVPTKVTVTAGLSDGQRTAISGDIAEGEPVIVGLDVP